MEKVDWVQKMIERESTPKSLRESSIEKFCEKYGISEATYYYNSSKKENQADIVKNCLLLAKKGTPDVLYKLREKAEDGDTKSIELFLKYVLELADKLKLGEDPDNRFKLPLTLTLNTNGKGNADKPNDQAGASLDEAGGQGN
jgi:hypothetical protein